VEVVFILLPLALLVAGIMLALFIWAVRSGQYDDLETPAVRILFEDGPAAANKKQLPDDSRRIRREPDNGTTSGERIEVR